MRKATTSAPEGGQASSSSTNRSQDISDPHTDDSDLDDDPTVRFNQDDALLLEDPMGDIGNGSPEPVSFLRKAMQKGRLHPPNTQMALPSSSATSPLPRSPRHRLRQIRDRAIRSPGSPSIASSSGATHGLSADNKDSVAIDWNVEGPGRRVGYEDLSTIDWIFEYAKERQRQRVLRANTPGFVGYLQRLLDASHVWVVLVLTGIAVGVLAAGINVASDWLGDIKTGYCHRGQGGGQFYLNKSFCCWGHEDFGQCSDWRPWRQALRIPSKGGGYVVELIFYILYSVLFAVCASFLVKQYSIHAKHSGIPEIKTVLGGFVIRRFLGAWTLVTKSLGLCLTVASGLWAGKEGPLIHVACCCANIIMKPLETLEKNEARKREVLSAAAAAGISVAFGSPVGGVLFSLEQLSYYFPDKTMWQSFVCAMVAAVTLQFMNPFRTGKIVLYEVRYSTGWHDFEVVPFILLGIVGGLYGGLFIKLNMIVAKFRRSSANPLNLSPVVEVLFVAFISSLVNFPNIFMRAQLSEVVYYLFSECAALGSDDPLNLCKTTTAGNISIFSLLLTASALGFLLAAVTFGLMLPAGIILPSLAIGALYGRALGIFMQLIHKAHPSLFIFSACEPDVPCITPGTYAIVGAASALAGVTRLTVSIVVIMFELTGALTYVLPIMIAVMLSKWIGDAISPKGIYESWIKFNGYPFLDNHDDRPAPDIPASNIMTRLEDLACLSASTPTDQPHTISSLQQLLNSSPFRGYPVISSPHDPILLGYISRTELAFALDLALSRNSQQSTKCCFSQSPTSGREDSLDLRPWTDQTPITLSHTSSFALVKDMFQRLGVRWLAFTDKGRLRGIVTKKDVWEVLEGLDRDVDNSGFIHGTAENDGLERGESEGEEERGLLRDT